MESLAAIGVFAWLFLFVLAILWFFLPFAIFGTKPKLDALIAEQKKTNQLLAEVREILNRVG